MEAPTSSASTCPTSCPPSSVSFTGTRSVEPRSLPCCCAEQTRKTGLTQTIKFFFASLTRHEVENANFMCSNPLVPVGDRNHHRSANRTRCVPRQRQERRMHRHRGSEPADGDAHRGNSYQCDLGLWRWHNLGMSSFRAPTKMHCSAGVARKRSLSHVGVASAPRDL